MYLYLYKLVFAILKLANKIYFIRKVVYLSLFSIIFKFLFDSYILLEKICAIKFINLL